MSACRRLTMIAFLVVGLAATGCAPRLRTQVETASDRPPAASASYRVELTDEQRDDLEQARFAATLHGRMTRAGFVRAADDAAGADVTVRFVLEEANQVEARPASAGSVGWGGGTEVESSQTSVGGVAVPGTRRTTVTRSTDTGVALGGPGSVDRLAREVRLRLMFSDANGPSHKVTVSARPGDAPLHTIAPCLVDAAFEGFPRADGQRTEIVVDRRECERG